MQNYTYSNTKVRSSNYQSSVVNQYHSNDDDLPDLIDDSSLSSDNDPETESESENEIQISKLFKNSNNRLKLMNLIISIISNEIVNELSINDSINADNKVLLAKRLSKFLKNLVIRFNLSLIKLIKNLVLFKKLITATMNDGKDSNVLNVSKIEKYLFYSFTVGSLITVNESLNLSLINKINYLQLSKLTGLKTAELKINLIKSINNFNSYNNNGDRIGLKLNELNDLKFELFNKVKKYVKVV